MLENKKEVRQRPKKKNNCEKKNDREKFSITR